MTEDDYKWADRFAYRFDEMGESEARLAKCYRALRVANATLRTERDEARKLAVEALTCDDCAGYGWLWLTLERDIASRQKTECASCSGTGHDARVAAWVT